MYPLEEKKNAEIYFLPFYNRFGDEGDRVSQDKLIICQICIVLAQ